MPGICLRTGRSGLPGDFERMLTDCRHFDDYESTVIRDDPGLQLGCVAYSAYPVQVLEDETHLVCLEGELYDECDDGDLFAVAEAAHAGDRDTVRGWIRRFDGEFVVYAVEKATGSVAVVTDVFARLPLYYRRTGDGIVLGREVGFVLDGLSSVSFDRLGIAECLLFGYLLEDRTLWSSVRKVPPAGFVRAPGSGEITVDRVQEFDFGGTTHDDCTVEENARALADRFVAACGKRAAEGRPNVVSLSGGHDSRSVVSGFDRGDLPYTTATFRRHGQESSADVTIARSVADALETDWTRYDLPPHSVESMATLLKLKRGLNHVGMGFILPFFEELRADHGSGMIYLTGDGGDKALPDLRPPKSLDGLADLTDYTLERNSVFSLPEVAELTGLDEETIRAEVRSVLAGYPESEPKDAYVHFITHNRGFNWLFEGEDRNRCYFWSTTPFYAVPFFEYAMNVPGEQKANNRLYREFLATLWPEAIEFPDADFRTPMASSRYRLVQHGLSALRRFPALERIAASVYRGELGFSYPPNVAKLMRSGLEECDAVGEPLARDVVRSYADSERATGRSQVFHLLTVVTAIDEVACEGRSLARLSDRTVQ